MKNRVLKVALAIILIMTLTMADFLLVGANLVTYAIGNVDDATNHENVKFSAYFKAEGKESPEAKYEIDNQEMKLYMKVAVKTEGYFEGKITLNASNFKLKEEILSDDISQIEENTITLKRVVAGETVEIEIGIEPIVEEDYVLNMLSKESTLELTGKYKDSTEQNLNIEANKKVNLTLLAPNSLETTLETKVITNKIYEIEETEKRLVQVELNSTVLNNAYPIKTTTFEITLPEGAEAREVITKGTYATNGEAEQKLEYTVSENNVLKVKIENTIKDGKIAWKQDAKDSIIATLLLDKDVEIGTDEYTVKAVVEFQGEEGKTKEKEAKYSLVEEADGIITTSVENKEEIYKGKIYSKEEREYKTATNIEVNYANLVENAIVTEKTVYRTETEEKAANVEYKTTTITKENVQKIQAILGEEGKLIISDGSRQIQKITKQTEAKDIVIEHKAGVKEVQVEITNTVETGIIKLEHTKVIKAEEYTKEEITGIKQLVEQVKVKYRMAENNYEGKAELKETKTVAELTVVPQTLSTATVNEQVKLAITLRSDNEKYDLYKNPTLRIKLPDYVRNIEFTKTTPLYLENMEITSFQYLLATKEIEIKLQGEQTKYNGINTNMYIEILANIELEETMPNEQTSLTLTYTNEKAVQYENGGKDNAIINVQGYSGLVAFNYIENYNIKTNSIKSEDEQVGNLKMYEEATEANFKIALVNNTQNEFKNLKILGNLPVDGNVTIGDYIFENTIGATLKEGINIKNGEAKIYYTSNREATNDINNVENGWNENLVEVSNPVLYLIVISNMAKETNFIANYTMSIPANLEYDKDMKTTYVANYEGNTRARSVGGATISATPVGLETGKVSAILEATVGTETLQNEMTVKAGEVIKYKITATNNGSNDATNVKIVGLVPEGSVYVQPMAEFEYAEKTEDYYEEAPDKTEVEFELEVLKAGETKTLEYEVRVKSDTTTRIATNQVTVNYNNQIEVKSNELTNKLEAGDIRVTIKRRTDVDKLLVPEAYVEYYYIVENISDFEQKGINLSINLPEYLRFINVKEVIGEEMTEVDGTNIEIENIPAKSCKIYQGYYAAKTIEASMQEFAVNAIATCNNTTYRSNAYMEKAYSQKIEMATTISREQEYLKVDDTIEYQITITNNSLIGADSPKVELDLPNQLTIQKIEIDGYEEEILNEKYFYKLIVLEPNASMSIKITAVVDYDPNRVEIETVSSSIVLYLSDEVVKTEPVIHYLEAVAQENVPTEPEPPSTDIQGPPTGEEPENPPTDPDNPPIDPDEPPTDPDNPSEKPEEPEKKKYNISGKGWLDQNKDGEMNNGDTIIKGIKVKLLDVETNKFVRNSEGNKDLVLETTEEGVYFFENIVEGKYIVVFEYDKTLNKPTIYQKEGISENKNSNVISKNLTINGEEKEYAITNEINLTKNISNVNIGLVFIKKFDIQVDKYISKVVVQNSKETTTYNYENKDFAKVEINAKRIVGSTILVQYTIKVTNIGDVQAYVDSLVDYAPEGLKFSSELNKDWYEAEGNLYTNSLEKQAIEPGESKTINLILTKTKTDGNAELINNMAEIQEAYNIYGIADLNSTYANKNINENDLGSADLMISIQTGTAFNYIIVVFIMLTIVGVAVYIINKKILEEKF